MKTMRPAGLTLLDVIVIIAVLGFAACLLLPTLHHNDGGRRRVGCASNLSQIGKAMIMYADQPNNGMFPSLSTIKDDPYGSSGDAQTALGLLYKQYLNDPRVFSCSTTRLPPARLQRLVAYSLTSSDWKAMAFTESDPCSFGYSPGHTQDQSQVIVLADLKGKQQNSDNHGPNVGQNVLRAGGNVEFCTTIVNNMGQSEDGSGDFLSDPDIYAPGGLPKHPELDSYCR
jgi:competence protein ComGC